MKKTKYKTGYLLVQLGNAVTWFRNQKLQDQGLTSGQAGIISYIKKCGDKGATVGNLATGLNLSKATVSEMIKILEKKILVERREDITDGRKSIIFLTEQGLSREKRLRSVAEESVSVILNGMTEEEKMLKILLKSVREYKISSLLCPVLMVFEATMDILIPFIMTFVIGELEKLAKNPAYQINTGKLVILFILLFLSAFCALFFGVAGGKCAAKASCGFAYNLREDLYDKIQSFSFADIGRFSTASLITRITTDVTNVQNAYQMCLRGIVRAPVLLVVAVVMTVMIEWKISLIFVVAAILLGVVVTASMIKVALPFRVMFKKYDDLNLVVKENLTAIRVVKSFVRERHEIQKMNQAAGEVYEYSVKAEKIMSCLVPCATFAMYLTNIVILFTGTNMAVGHLPGNVSAADLQTMVAYSGQILTGVLMVAMSINYVSMSKGSIDRICEVLLADPSIVSPQDSVNEVKDGSVEFEHVDFAYSMKSDVPVLQDINLKIASGETIGIIGATGSGKSSLVSLIPRLYDVIRGTIKVGGINVKEYSLEILRNEVAMVLQNNVLFSGSVRENLLWGDEKASEEEIRLAARQACAEEFIEELPGGYTYDLGREA